MKLTASICPISIALCATLALAGCGSPEKAAVGGRASIKIDGSSTVGPISSAVAEEFQAANQGTRVTVSISGTGAGMKKLVDGTIDIADASRPIEQKEMDAAKTADIDFIELPVAYDGLAILVHKENTWVDHLTVAELKKVWEAGSSVKLWSDVRPSWPKTPIKLYGPGTNSGTYDYFTEAICGKKGNSRPDYTASEDDNTLVTGIAGDKSSLGYFGYAYYVENKDKLKLVPVDGGKGPVAPSEATVVDGTYEPLSRPLFIYVNAKAAARPEVQKFVGFYLTQASELVKSVGYVPLAAEVYELAKKRFEAKKTGSLFGGGKVGMKLGDILEAEQQ